tara:strand:- start:1158 stop:1484 length:327 start_codon:yes stop_codon:yes gene_type:complete
MAGVFDTVNVTLIIAGVLLLIAALVIRDQTQFRISQLRSELMGLRNEEKRLSERRDEIELMVAQVGDGPDAGRPPHHDLRQRDRADFKYPGSAWQYRTEPEGVVRTRP